MIDSVSLSLGNFLEQWRNSTFKRMLTWERSECRIKQRWRSVNNVWMLRSNSAWSKPFSWTHHLCDSENKLHLGKWWVSGCPRSDWDRISLKVGEMWVHHHLAFSLVTQGQPFSTFKTVYLGFASRSGTHCCSCARLEWMVGLAWHIATVLGLHFTFLLGILFASLLVWMDFVLNPMPSSSALFSCFGGTHPPITYWGSLRGRQVFSVPTCLMMYFTLTFD